MKPAFQTESPISPDEDEAEASEVVHEADTGGVVKGMHSSNCSIELLLDMSVHLIVVLMLLP